MVKPTKPSDNVEIEAGAEKRLANILKKALNTPPPRKRGSNNADPRKPGPSRRPAK